ncbi:MAG: hypothetical protein EPO36_10260 [Chloroflexota bacterium]|nr:MAG: hypothetical protein EPO36_10260 [Chloroflexota bacterium]
MDDTPSVPVERTGPAPIARIGLLGAAAAALVAVGILVFGSSATPAGTLAAYDTATPNDALVYANGGPGFGGRGGFGPGGITITAISGSSISLETADGWTRTITVDGDTTYSESGDTIAQADLAVGDQIRFEQTLEDDGTWTIDAIAVIPPHAGGAVTAISGSTITVERRDGTEATITVTSSTTYTVSGDAATLADVEVGMVLFAEGTENSDGSLTATEVHAGDPGEFRGRGGPGHGPRFNDATEDDTASDSAS